MIWVLGVLVGLVLGLTGAGGGILAVPALMFGLGWSVTQASPVALLAVAGAAWVGTVDGLRSGLTRYRAAVVMAVAAVPSVSLGLMLAHRLPAGWLTVLFALIMVMIALRLLLLPQRRVEHEHVICRIQADSGRFIWTVPTFLAITGFGVFSGLLTGLLGVGGGFVIVPVLARFTELSQAAVVATSLMVVALISTFGFALAWLQGAHLPLSVTLPFLMTVMAGMVMGRLASRHVSASVSQRGFSWLMLAVALALLVHAGYPDFGV